MKFDRTNEPSTFLHDPSTLKTRLRKPQAQNEYFDRRELIAGHRHQGFAVRIATTH
jgi:hypothetical protein